MKLVRFRTDRSLPGRYLRFSGRRMFEHLRAAALRPDDSIALLSAAANGL